MSTLDHFVKDAPADGADIDGDDGSGRCENYAMRAQKPMWNAGACEKCKRIDDCTRDTHLMIAAMTAQNLGAIAALIDGMQAVARGPGGAAVPLVGRKPGGRVIRG